MDGARLDADGRRPRPAGPSGLSCWRLGWCVRRSGLVTLPARMHEVQTCSRFGRTVDHGPHPLHVGVPAPLGAPVGVAHVHAERGLLATDIAHCCHWRTFLGEAAVDGPRRPSRTAQRLASPAMTSPATLGADDLRAVMGGYRDALRLHQADINRLNVYPVPDGDTGTNMALTLEAVVSELDGRRGRGRPARGLQGHRARLAHGRPGQLGRDPLPAPARHERAHGARPGRPAWAPTSWSRPSTTPPSWPGEAVVRPVEGTILTVASAAADRGGARGPGLVGVVESARGRGGRRAGPHARDAARPGPGRRGRRRRQRLSAPARRLPPRARRPPAARALRASMPRTSAPSTRRRRRAGHDGAGGEEHAVGRPALRGHVLPRTRPTTPSRPSRRCGRASATPSSWSAATACGTATSTPTTSAPPSRPAWTPGARTASG